MDKCREQFEEWASKEGFKMARADDPWHYDWASTASAWKSWQASRQELVVELPATCCRTLVFEIEGTNEVGMEHDEYYEVDDIISVLSSAGIKCT